MVRLAGRSIVLMFLGTGIVLSMSIAIVLIVIQLLGGEAAIDKVACYLDLSEECVRNELDEERRKLKGLRKRNRELEAIYQRLRRLDHASESFVVFYTDHSGDHTVTSGHRYASLIDPATLIGGWCYINLPSPAGVSSDVFVAHMDEDRVVTPDTVTDEALEHAGLTQKEITAAFGRCHWPKGAVS